MFTQAVSKQQKLANICKWQIVPSLAHPSQKRYGKTFCKIGTKQKRAHLERKVIFTEGERMKLVKRVSCRFSLCECV